MATVLAEKAPIEGIVRLAAANLDRSVGIFGPCPATTKERRAPIRHLFFWRR
jgi:hypothetical protein